MNNSVTVLCMLYLLKAAKDSIVKAINHVKRVVDRHLLVPMMLQRPDAASMELDT